MAEVVIPVGYGSAVINWNTSNKPEPLTVTLGYATAGTFISAQGNANAIMTALTDLTGGAGPCSPAAMLLSYQLTGVYVYERRVAGPLVRGDSTNAPVVGSVSGAGTELVVNTTLRVSKRTAFVGRQYRGRMYAPYTRAEADINSTGVISSVPLNAIRQEWGRFLTRLQALPILAQVLHTDPAIAPTEITSLFVQGFCGTQRRRLDR